MASGGGAKEESVLATGEKDGTLLATGVLVDSLTAKGGGAKEESSLAAGEKDNLCWLQQQTKSLQQPQEQEQKNSCHWPHEQMKSF